MFLCDDAEVVATAWDSSEIDRAQEVYLQHPLANIQSLNRANNWRASRGWSATLTEMRSATTHCRRVRRPKSYRGAHVEERHQEFLARLSRRLRELATA